MTDGEKTIEIEVLRYRPEQDKGTFSQSYKVPFTDEMSVLQGLQYIKDNLDSTLSFRWSCRMAICGSCGMMIQGVPKLACRTFLRHYHPKKLRVGPLEHFPIERDLVVRVEDFIRKLESVKPYIIPKKPRKLEEGEYLQTPAQLEHFRQYSTCINCMLCYSACPQYGLDSHFYGPGILSLLHRYNADSRDAGRAERMKLGHSEEGFWGCTAVGYCSVVCPKSVDPAQALNSNKMNSAIDYFLRFVTPRGAGR
ncbi:MAG: succinate dehydrogenase/fumarate reductase iron-sulfur subunit [Betaproteobacteria bacterium]|nr:succinate dehydrogenase/fumarate reductase iron-sulfur subunit [Betaproteobacteria bacterium]